MTSLTAFHPLAEASAQPKMSGEIAWKGGGLELAFRIEAPAGLLLDGPGATLTSVPGEKLRREHNLWKTTCFEAFFARAGEAAYWELNVSASGGWNLYRFSAYREPQPPAVSEDFKLAELRAGGGLVRCRLEPRIAPCALEASLCVVARTEGDAIAYFSTKHAGNKPDFHLRESFTLKVSP